MALKKNYQSGTKYYYARIQSIIYNKDLSVAVGIVLWERDSDIINQATYDGLSDEDKLNYVQSGDDWELNWVSTSPIYMDISLDSDPVEFQIVTLDTVNKNMIKTCYEWIKANVDMFNSTDWSNV